MGHIIRNHILLIFWDNGVMKECGWKNITYSSTWQRLSFLSSLPLQTLQHDSPSSYFLLQLPHQVQSESWCCFWWQANFPRPQLQKLPDLAGLHCTTSERSGPSLHSMQHNFLSRPLSFLDWTTTMLFKLDLHNAQSNLYRGFRMQRHNLSSANPKGPMSNLSLSPCTGSRLQLTSSSRHWCLYIEQALTQHPHTSSPLWQSTSPQEVWDLWASVASWCHHREAQNHSPERLSFTVPGCGMNFPSPIRNAESPDNFQSDTWKLISSITTWLHLKKKIHVSFLSLTLLYFP